MTTQLSENGSTTTILSWMTAWPAWFSSASHWPKASFLFVNAGEILQRPAGVKVQHGRKQEGPDIGAFLLVPFHS
jgi:hypothetical protein